MLSRATRHRSLLRCVPGAAATLFWGLATGAGAATLDVVGGVLVYAATLGAVNALSVSLDSGVYTIMDSGETIALAAGAVGAGCTSPSANTARCPEAAIAAWSVDLGNLDDAASFAPVIEPTTLRGGPGNDTITGGVGPDTFVWLPGDGSDSLDGAAGGDTLDFDGNASSEIYAITALAGGFQITRNVGNVVVQTASIELLSLATSGSNDTVNTVGLSGTLQTIDGGDPTTAPGDTISYDAAGVCITQTQAAFLTPGLQVVSHTGFESASVLNACTGLPSALDVQGGVLAYTAGVGATNFLTAALAAGVYTIDDPRAPAIALGAGAVAEGCTSLGLNRVSCPRAGLAGWSVSLGDLADTALLGAVLEPVTLRGGPGDDALTGGAASDTFVWTPGDGSDGLDGGPGDDLLDFDGSNGNEIFAISRLLAGFRITRNIGNVVVQAVSVEGLWLEAFGGDDLVDTEGLPTTTQILNAGSQSTGDTLGYDPDGGCVILGPGSIQTPGSRPVHHFDFESTPTLEPCPAPVPAAGPWSLALLGLVLLVGSLATASARPHRT